MDDLKGKRVVITGAGTGLGAAAAIGLAKRGANVAVNYASSAEAAEKVAQACRDEGVDAFAIRGDVAEDDDCRRLIDETVARFGGLDVLVNNAGVTKVAPAHDMDLLDAADFEWIFRINLIGAYQMVRAARSALEEAAGENAPSSIVNISSNAAISAGGSSIAYSASKAALNNMTLGLARALAPKIRVNAVCPGYIDSGWFTKWVGKQADEGVARQMEEATPLKVVSTPEDIAEAVIWFASNASRHVTGENLLIDGGIHMGSALRVR